MVQIFPLVFGANSLSHKEFLHCASGRGCVFLWYSSPFYYICQGLPVSLVSSPIVESACEDFLRHWTAFSLHFLTSSSVPGWTGCVVQFLLTEKEGFLILAPSWFCFYCFYYYLFTFTSLDFYMGLNSTSISQMSPTPHVSILSSCTRLDFSS